MHRLQTLSLPAPQPHGVRRHGRRSVLLGAVACWACGSAVGARLPGIEPLQRIASPASSSATDPTRVALTLDACGGGYDAPLVALLVRLKIPATVFVTRRWLDRQPQGLRDLLAHPELFELQNHGAQHRPALVGARLYSMRGPDTLDGVQREIQDGAKAVERATGRKPVWYRGAGARYDDASLALIRQLGYRVAGYSLNADDGAQASPEVVARRVQAARPGDIILAHMNHPASGTAEGLESALPDLQRRGLQFVRLSEVEAVVDLPPHQARQPRPPRPPQAASVPQAS